MEILVTPDLLINLAQIAYVQRHAGRPTRLTVHFASAGGNGGSAGLSLDLEGANADQLISRLTRLPGEEPGMSS